MLVSFLGSLFMKALFMSLMVLMFVSVMSFTHNNSLKLQQEHETLNRMTRHVVNYQGTARQDSSRKEAIGKIIGIIKYELELSEITDDKVKLIKEYATLYDQMTDAKAEQMITIA